MPLRRAPSWVHSDGAGAAIIGVGYLAHALTYFNFLIPPLDWPAHVLEGLASRPVWGLIWGAVALLCLLGSVWKRILPAAIGAAVSMAGLWGLSWAVESIVEHHARHASSAVGWCLVTVLVVWALSRGKAGDVRLEKVRVGEFQ